MSWSYLETASAKLAVSSKPKSKLSELFFWKLMAGLAKTVPLFFLHLEAK